MNTYDSSPHLSSPVGEEMVCMSLKALGYAR